MARRVYPHNRPPIAAQRPLPAYLNPIDPRHPTSIQPGTGTWLADQIDTGQVTPAEQAILADLIDAIVLAGFTVTIPVLTCLLQGIRHAQQATVPTGSTTQESRP